MLRRAYTLIELLVVLAIITVLASLLLPVFATARAAAQRTTCASNMKQAHMATLLYTSDYDDRLMPMNHLPGGIGNSGNDRTWAQLILPYMRSFQLFRCPSDYGARPKPESTFDQDLVPGDTDSRYFSASMRSNIGYNYLYLAPVMRYQLGPWQVSPRSISQIATSETILFVDTVWDRRPDGTPYGGGNWLVAPPCRYARVNGIAIDSFGGGRGTSIYLPDQHREGWKVHNPNSGMVYGGAWPWHEGRMNTVRIGGNVKSIAPPELSAGCEVRPGWQGRITDPSAYLWDIQ
ncbi:MAG TPA: DUF1559 domain-containing protein [Fimbriimonadaceae bacterium]|nr:DUF1559 domain-containing protein [Fimbriimonadaceae bacterium]